MTAVYITAIIAITLLANSIVVAIRDVAKAKKQGAAPCCCDHNDKEKSA